MESGLVLIDNRGNGFENALEETRKAADRAGLTHKESIHLQLCAEEMLSLARSVTGEMQASFQIESEGKSFELQMSTKTVLDKEKRYLLISSSTSGKNEVARSFLGRLRDAFENAMAADVDHSDPIDFDPHFDLPGLPAAADEWDGFEKSVLKRVADRIRIWIRGGQVTLAVSKRFE